LVNKGSIPGSGRLRKPGACGRPLPGYAEGHSGPHHFNRHPEPGSVRRNIVVKYGRVSGVEVVGLCVAEMMGKRFNPLEVSFISGLTGIDPRNPKFGENTPL
jgi:hypothetical protein